MAEEHLTVIELFLDWLFCLITYKWNKETEVQSCVKDIAEQL